MAAVRTGLGRPEQQLRQPDGAVGRQGVAHGREPDLAAGRARRPGAGDGAAATRTAPTGLKTDLGHDRRPRVVCADQEPQAARRSRLLAEEAGRRPDAEAGQVHLRPGADAPGPGFWNRPELRLYVTHAKWNDAANAAAGAGGVTGIAARTTQDARAPATAPKSRSGSERLIPSDDDIGAAHGGPRRWGFQPVLRRYSAVKLGA